MNRRSFFGALAGAPIAVVAAKAEPDPKMAPLTLAVPRMELSLRGLDGRKLYSGDDVRELAEKLVDFQRDGHQVVLPL